MTSEFPVNLPSQIPASALFRHQDLVSACSSPPPPISNIAACNSFHNVPSTSIPAAIPMCKEPVSTTSSTNAYYAYRMVFTGSGGVSDREMPQIRSDDTYYLLSPSPCLGTTATSVASIKIPIQSSLSSIFGGRVDKSCIPILPKTEIVSSFKHNSPVARADLGLEDWRLNQPQGPIYTKLPPEKVYADVDLVEKTDRQRKAETNVNMRIDGVTIPDQAPSSYMPSRTVITIFPCLL
ncbi:unnamed protein product [Protopolystoma xenopodis]|uniref:Uncharacterized protein n=1 Tax=Protopolystoma xenopodis TaxID=117903 RepID=A0A3S5A1M9_9PLAT|nr:unnamed protein product [Protopolystoma xenopodis]